MNRLFVSVYLPIAFASVATSTLAGCGGDKIDPRFPPRPEGCQVDVFHDQAPTVPTDNLGTVSASCSDITSDEDCLRTLKDQVCKMGGDVVWGVEPKPEVVGNKKRLNGRAAKTKGAKPVHEYTGT